MPPNVEKIERNLVVVGCSCFCHSIRRVFSTATIFREKQIAH